MVQIRATTNSTAMILMPSQQQRQHPRVAHVHELPMESKQSRRRRPVVSTTRYAPSGRSSSRRRMRRVDMLMWRVISRRHGPVNQVIHAGIGERAEVGDRFRPENGYEPDVHEVAQIQAEHVT